MNITPETKIAELLKEYPQLEDVLIKYSPAFSALKNPILRRTVAKVTSLQQASKVGNVSVIEIVNILRTKVGQQALNEAILEEKIEENIFIPENITHHFDARPFIEGGDHPKELISKIAKELKAKDCLEIITPFPPIPIVDLLKKKGFKTHILDSENGFVKTYIWI